MFAHLSKSCRNCQKVPKPRKLAGYECPREIYVANALGTETRGTLCDPSSQVDNQLPPRGTPWVVGLPLLLFAWLCQPQMTVGYPRI